MNIIAPRFIVVALLAALLSGCSNAPSDAEMEEALLVVLRGDTGPSTRISAFEARKCKAFENGVYRCQVKALMHFPSDRDGRSEEKTLPFSSTYDFVEESGGWKLVN